MTVCGDRQAWDSSSLHLQTAAFYWSPGTVSPVCVVSRVVSTVSVDPDFKGNLLFVNFESKNTSESKIVSEVTWRPGLLVSVTPLEQT